MTRELDSYDQRVIEVFRANGGVVDPGLDLLLRHVGARSGRERVTPLAYWRVDDTTVAVLASNRGAPKHPDWYHNLVANPIVTVEVGPETFQARAIVSEGADRDRLVVERSKSNPAFIRNQERAGSRQIPLVWLERI